MGPGERPPAVASKKQSAASADREAKKHEAQNCGSVADQTPGVTDSTLNVATAIHPVDRSTPPTVEETLPTVDELIGKFCSEHELSDDHAQQLSLKVFEKMSQLTVGDIVMIFFNEVNSFTGKDIKQLCADIGNAIKRQEPAELFEVPEKGFEIDYMEHPDTSRFLQHVRTTRAHCLDKHRLPYFAVCQSSGFGKSRLVEHVKTLVEANDDDFVERFPLFKGASVVILTFGKDGAYPYANVEPGDWEGCELLDRAQATQKLTKLLRLKIPTSKNKGNPTSNFTLFVVDEAAELFKSETKDGISLFRCLRTAMKNIAISRNVHFVVMSTYSSVSSLSPSPELSSSYKMADIKESDRQLPLDPFFLVGTFDVVIQGNTDVLLTRSVNDCLTDDYLLTLGRPLWHAFRKAGMLSKQLIAYARSKLTKNAKDVEDPSTFSTEQLLALVACRACLAISPESRFAHSLVEEHMATAFQVTQDRHLLTTSYPSEPILAIASRDLTDQTQTVWLKIVSALTSFHAHGAVPKGIRGELIVRLLNLMAIDRAMKNIKSSQEEMRSDFNGNAVSETPLVEFLSQFGRSGHEVDAKVLWKKANEDEVDVGFLIKAGLYDSQYHKDLEAKKEEEKAEKVQPIEGSVCFTHFIHISSFAKRPILTHDLLREAYRRTAAIVVDDVRRGIDWVIPVRIGDDQFIGLVGQDKNRVGDTLDALVDVESDVTYHKVVTKYFLAPDELQTFEDAGVGQHNWPSVVFAVGVDEPGVGTAMLSQRITRKSESEADVYGYPCIILTGLDYLDLVGGDAANDAMKQFHNFEVNVPNHVKRSVPLTYGRFDESDEEIDMLSDGSCGKLL